MNAKILSLCLMVLVAISLNGCWCEPQIEYIERPVEVKVPQKCTLPNPECNFEAETYTEVVANMLKCVEDYKFVLNKCKGE